MTLKFRIQKKKRLKYLSRIGCIDDDAVVPQVSLKSIGDLFVDLEPIHKDVSRKRPDSGISLWSHFVAELTSSESNINTESPKTQRILNFLAVPFEVEKLMTFGYLICLDSFLHIFTILPIRIVIAMGVLLFQGLFRTRALTSSEKTDLMKGVLILASSFFLQHIDASKLYHSIRGQAIIKLYVIFNALEICDKLCSAFGHDILDSLFSTMDPLSANRRFNRVARMLVAITYITAHTLVLFYQVMSLNVAVNSHNNALLTLLISNQFVEIKGSVFKKFEKGNLFQLSCSDIVERFQLSVFLLIVSIRNCLEIFGNGVFKDTITYIGSIFTLQYWNLIIWNYSELWPYLYNLIPNLIESDQFKVLAMVFGPSIVVYSTEIGVDWIKHAFIVKFNSISPKVYNRYRESLCRDLIGVGEVRDRAVMVSKRIGFVSIPLACMVIRIAIQILGLLIVQDPGLQELGWDEDISGETAGGWRFSFTLTQWIKSHRHSASARDASFIFFWATSSYIMYSIV